MPDYVLRLRPLPFFRLICRLAGFGLACLALAGCGATVYTSHDSPPKTSLILWPNPAAIVYGTALSAAQLNATASVPGSFTYTPAMGAVLNAGPQTLSVTFTPTDSTDYTAATASVSLTVNPSAAILTWPTPAPIPHGTALSAAQLNASANVPGTFAYMPGRGSVLGAGTQTLSVTFTPANTTDYTSASASVILSVNRSTPRITWTPRDPIAVNVPLSEAQLDATASAADVSTPVAGTFVYSPDAGTTFSSTGPRKLSVSFTPADARDYTTAEDSIVMTVGAFGVAAWGDSLTAGNEGLIDKGNYPADLQKSILLPVKNLGFSARTSLEIGVREGGIPAHVTVSGGTIPASAGVVVNFPTGYAPANLGMVDTGVTGTILGVHGSLMLNSGVYTFSRTTPGSPVNAPGTPQFVVDTPYAGYLPVFWEGINDIFADGVNASAESQVLSDIAAQVATVPPGQTFLVMSLINANTKDEWMGAWRYKQIKALNDQLANTYGSNYLDVHELLVSKYDKTQATDVSDFQHDEVPTSLRAINLTATLANSIGPSDTVFTLASPSYTLSAADILTIDKGENAENVEIAAVAGNVVTVVRNYGGLNTSHAAGVPVTETDYIHLNAKGYQIVADAVAEFLSPYKKP